MIKLETKEVIQEVEVAKVCDICKAESLTPSNWSPEISGDMRLSFFVDRPFGDSDYKQMDFCPICFEKVALYAESLGGKFYDI